MSTGLQSLIDSGTRVWLDSVDPDEVTKNKAAGITGCTSNPIIIAGIVGSLRSSSHTREAVTRALEGAAESGCSERENILCDPCRRHGCGASAASGTSALARITAAAPP